MVQANRLIVLGGPTASGKTALSISLAKWLNAEIISADSMQIYKDMDIGTAKPSILEREGVSHHLIDIINPDEEFSAALFAQHAIKAIEEIRARGKNVIIVGGTGLYIQALLYPMALGNSEKSIEIRKKYDTILEQKGKEFLHELLWKIDPVSAKKISVNDVKRTIRALEIFELTGKTKSSFEEKMQPRFEHILYVIDWEREKLYQRINARVDIMFENGLLDEMKHLLDRGYGKSLQSMQAIGYRELFAYFDGTSSLDETKELIKKNSRNYAKRQMTWFRSKNPVILDANNSLENNVKRILADFV